MEGSAEIHSNGNTNRFKLNPLQIAEIASSAHGFYDIDLKDNDVGNYTIIAYGVGKSLQAKGRTIEQAVEKLLERFGC